MVRRCRTCRRILPALALLLVAPSLQAQDAQARLWDAAMAGDTTAIAQALADGAKVDELDTRRSVNGRFALNWAAWYNHPAAIRLLVARGADLEAENRTGFSALHHAAEAGSLDAARTLLALGADPTHANGMGVTPVETARERNNEAIAAVLDSVIAAKAARKP